MSEHQLSLNLTIPAPQEGAGMRDLECGKCVGCLDTAIKSGWPTFNCEACSLASNLEEVPGLSEKLRLLDGLADARTP